MKMPLDIRELLKTVADLGQERDLPVSVALVFDATADNRLIDHIIDAFRVSSPVPFIEQFILEDGIPEPSDETDLCVVIGGSSLLLGDVAESARGKGIPAVVVIAQGETELLSEVPSEEDQIEADEVIGTGIPVDDLMVIELDEEEARPLEELGRWIVQHVSGKRVAFADVFPFIRHPLAIELVHSTAIQNGAIGLVPLVPGTDMPLLTLNQAKMVLQIASAYDQPLDRDRVKEIFAVIAGGLGLRTIARELAGLVPVVGWLVKGTIACGATVGMGYLAVDYFEDGGHITAFPEILRERMGVQDTADAAD